MKNSMEFPQKKFQTELPNDPATSFWVLIHKNWNQEPEETLALPQS